MSKTKESQQSMASENVDSEIQKNPQSSQDKIDKDTAELIRKIKEDHQKEMKNLRKEVKEKLRIANLYSEVESESSVIPDCMMLGYDPSKYRGILGDLQDSEAAYSLRRLQDSFVEK